MFKSFIDKFNLDEPSTHAGIAAMLVSGGVIAPNPITTPIAGILAGIFGLISCIMKEKSKK